jgi:hypothetical protein
MNAEIAIMHKPWAANQIISPRQAISLAMASSMQHTVVAISNVRTLN